MKYLPFFLFAFSCFASENSHHTSHHNCHQYEVPQEIVIHIEPMEKHNNTNSFCNNRTKIALITAGCGVLATIITSVVVVIVTALNVGRAA